MARSTFVKAAQKDIYENGKYVKYTSKKGKKEGQELSKRNRTIPENKDDKILIAKGESYYWWQFKGSDKTISKTAPKRSQLTRSGYLSQLYDIQDQLMDIRDNVSDADDVSSALDDIKSTLEDMKSECESSLDNMPDGLRESSSSGELLQERIDSLDNAISELEGVDCDYSDPDEDELRKEAIEELQLDEDDEESLQDIETDINAAMERIKEEKLSEWLDEVCDEISNVSLD